MTGGAEELKKTKQTVGINRKQTRVADLIQPHQ